MPSLSSSRGLMNLTIVGSASAEPNPGSASSCYLIETSEGRVVLECGHGAAAKLLAHTTLEEIGAILISHMHPDHFFDLVPLKYGLSFHGCSKLDVYLPPGGDEVLAAMASALGEGTDFWTSAYNVHVFDPNQTLELQGMRISMASTHHFIPAWSMTIRPKAGGGWFGYTSDTSLTDQVVDHVRGADLLLAEASLRMQTDASPDQGHLTGEEAGKLATRAGVKRLVLTHYPSTLADEIFRDATAAYDGPCTLAREGDRYSL